jgi:hypothetical protein
MSHTHAYNEVYPPTTVQCAATGYFTRPVAQGGAAELLLARGNLVEVWSTRSREGGDGAALQCDASISLHAEVESLAVLRRHSGGPKTQRDALLVATREAKLSVLEWDPRTRGLRTTSLHRWEGRSGVTTEGGAQGSTRATETATAPKGPRVIADPEGRAAAVLLGGSGEVAIIPAVRAAASHALCVSCCA